MKSYYKNRKRREIIQAVTLGTMTTAHANAEAVRFVLEPFVKTPDPAKYDPTNEPSWSLLMAVAWIIWRDKNRVREVWDAARKVTQDWYTDNGVVRLGPPNPATFMELFAISQLEANRSDKGSNRERSDRDFLGGYSRSGRGFGGNPASENPAELAFRKLRDAATRGKINSTGVPICGGERRKLEAHVWCNIEIDDLAVAGKPKVPIIAGSGDWDNGWNRVLLPNEEIRKLWPADSSAKKQTVAAEKQCRDWLIEEMSASPETSTKSKGEWYRLGCDKFPGLGKKDGRTPSRSFVRAWDDAIQASDAR